MKEQKISFENECDFSEQEKELIDAIYNKCFIAIVNEYKENYKDALEDLLGFQNIFHMIIEAGKNKTEVNIKNEPYYLFRKDLFDKLFDLIEPDSNERILKVLEYIDDLLNNLCIELLIEGLNNGSIKQEDLETE